jgi:hypothetical protein
MKWIKKRGTSKEIDIDFQTSNLPNTQKVFYFLAFAYNWEHRLGMK